MKKCLALLLLLSLFLTACGQKQEPLISTTATQEPTQTEEPVLVQKDDVFGLSYMAGYGFNPFTCTATVNRGVFSLLYESLFIVSGEFRAVPVLCDSFRVANDGRTYIIRLVEGVRFSDGTFLNVMDVEASIDAARDSALYSERLEHIVSTDVTEDGELRIDLNTAYENLALVLDVPVVKLETLESDRPVGTGAYYLRGEGLLRNPYWWQESHGVLTAEQIPLTAAYASDELRDHFEFGSSDLIYCDPNSMAAVSYRCDFEVWEAPSTIMHYIGFNLYSGWFIGESLRSAVTYAIDRDSLVNTVYGGFAQATPLPCSPSSDLYDSQLAADYDYAPAKFAEAVQNSGVLTSGVYEGYVGTFLVCMDDPKRVAVAEHIAEVLNQAGIRVKVSALERKAYQTALEKGQFDLYLGETRLTANFDLTEFFLKYGNLQFGSISNAGYVTLCTEALANSGTYSDLYSQLLRDAPICPIVFKSYAIYVTRGMIETNHPGLDYVFHNQDTARTLADADKTYSYELEDAENTTEDES